jgi:hypothetical protein
MSATLERVGREGFKGSPITDWCDPCDDFVVRLNNGMCPWCDHKPTTQADLDLDSELLRLKLAGESDRSIGRLLGMDARRVKSNLDRILGVAA